MTDTTARIRAKGLDSTGITEDIATDLFNRVGNHFMAIVDLQVVDRHGPDVKGKRGVEIIIDGLEPAMDDQLAEHLRELTRTMYYNRQVATHGPTLDGPEERTVDDVLAAGKKHEPHPYLASTLSIDDDAICDVCGQHEGAAVHADRARLEDPFAVTEETEDDGTTDPTHDAGDTTDDDQEYVDEGEWAEEPEEAPATT